MSSIREWIRLGLVGCGALAIVATPFRAANAGPIWDHLTGKTKSPPCQSCGQIPVIAPANANPATNYYPGTIGGYPIQQGVAAGYAPLPTGAPAMAGVRGYVGTPVVSGYRPIVPAVRPYQVYRPWANPGLGASGVGAMQPVAALPFGAAPVGAAPVGAGLVGTGLVGAAPVCTACQRPLTVNIAPQVNYRTNWAQVPVTSYRPVAGIDPRTGQYVTVYQPCVTNAWQLQRVPTLIQRPAPFGAAVAPNAVNGSCNAALGPAAPPYYGGTIETPTQGPLGGQVPAGSTPADRPPTLNRDSGTTLGPQTRNYAPLTPVPPPSESSDTSSGIKSGITGSASRGATSSTSDTGNSSSAPAGPINKSIPDPDREPRKEIPPLLKSPPADRKASIPNRSMSTLIPTRLIQRLPEQKPSSSQSEAELSSQARPSRTNRVLPKLDDSGWQSSQP